MKIAVTDVETTGLDPLHHEMVSIGCVLFDSQTFEILDTFDRKIKIKHPERADAKALAVNGYKAEDWNDSKPLHSVILDYKGLVDGAYLLAHNVIFDYGFLCEAFKQSNVDVPFGRHKLDLLTLAWSKIPHGKMYKGWSLKKVCEALDIEPEPDVHTALNGAMKGYEVYKKLMS